jgi:hypothetical protein
MNKDEIFDLVKQKNLDYRPDNVSIFMEVSYPNSVVIEYKDNQYLVYLTTPRNEIGSTSRKFQDEKEAVEFFLTKVEEEKSVADKYAKIGLTWPPFPV